MRVLDIDLDFFVHPLPRGGLGKPDLTGDFRRSDESYRTWDASEVVAYLEGICGLSVSNRPPGQTVTLHDEAYRVWRERIISGSLEWPFDLVHLDAHSDLGMGEQPVWDIVESEILPLPIEQRAIPKPRGITEGTYLLFAIACGWVKELTYIAHPDRGPLDLITTASIQLRLKFSEMIQSPCPYSCGEKRPRLTYLCRLG